MGNVLLNDTDIFTGKLGDNSTTSRQVNGPSQMQLSDQAPTNADILSQHHLHSTIEREEQRQEQFDDVAKQGSFLAPPPKITNLEANNQDNTVSKSQWFPSVPSYFCNGEYSFVIEGINLDLDKLKRLTNIK